MKLSKSHKDKIALSKIGERNPMWKGKRVGYNAIHGWIKRHLKKPKQCQDCLQVKPLDIANISQKYKRDTKDWEWLCRHCHMMKDGRLLRLRKMRSEFNKEHTKVFVCPVCGKKKKRVLSLIYKLKTCSRKCGSIFHSRNKAKVCRLYGHPWSKQNTYISPKSGFRMCLACRKIKNASKG